MSWRDLREWLAQVEALGELRVVTGATWQEDIGGVTEMLDHTPNSPCVLFDQIPGYPAGRRVIVNCNGTRRRQAVTLGMPPQEASHEALFARWRQILDEFQPIPPQTVEDGPVLENSLEGGQVDLELFPAPMWHPKDGGRFIGTASINIMRDPDTGWVNLGTYRNQILGPDKLGIWISPGKHGRAIREKYFERGQKCPIVVLVGSDPLLFWSACVEGIPYGLSEFDWVGGVQRRPVQVIRGPVTGLPIPAAAEIAIEGFMTPGEMHIEGPYGEWTGYYASGTPTVPVIQVAAIHHRHDPIILGCPQGKPPHEDNQFLAYLKSALIQKQIEAAGVSGVSGVWCPPEGGNRLLVIVSLKQRYPGHARQVAHVAAQCGAAAYNGRYVVVVDDDIDIFNPSDVLWAVLTRSDPAEDVELIRRAWSSPLDPMVAKGAVPFNSRAIIDATIPWERRGEFAEAIVKLDEARAVREKWGHILQG
ncbi:MAG: UbiD family decarboxylase [Anaerolineae bacterium]